MYILSMSSQAINKRNKAVVKKQEVVPVVALPVVEQVVEVPVVPAPVPVVALPVVEVPAPVEASKPARKRVAKKEAPVVVPAPVAEVVVPAPVPVVEAPKVEAVPAVAEPVKKVRKARAPAVAGAKKPRAKKAPAKAKKAKVAKKQPKKPVDDIKLSEETRTRYFKLVLGDHSAIGRFSGNKPRQAASKALTSIIRKQIEEKTYVAEKDIVFSLKECTRWNKKKCNKGSAEKIYMYTGRREPLPAEVLAKMQEKPVVHNKDKPESEQKRIVYKFCNKVRKFKPLPVVAPVATK